MAQIDTKFTARAQQPSGQAMASRFQRPPTQISWVDRRTPEDVAAIQRLSDLMKRL
jgi:ubiquitin